LLLLERLENGVGRAAPVWNLLGVSQQLQRMSSKNPSALRRTAKVSANSAVRFE
jgi:hypothetical protein